MRAWWMSAVAAATVVSVAGCSVGGGGSTGGTAVIPGSGSGAHPASSKMAIALHIPATPAGSSAATAARFASSRGHARPQLISAAANGLAIALYVGSNATPAYQADVDISGNNATSGTTCTADPTGGGRTCTITIVEPAGTYDFVISTYASSPAPGFTGPALDSGNAGTYTLTPGTPVSISVVLGGVVAALALTVPTFDGYGSSTVPVGVVALDAANEVIISSAPYATPIALAVSATPAVTLSVNGGAASTSVTSTLQTDHITLSYPGAASATAAGSIGVTATAGSATATATVAPLFISASNPAVVAAAPPSLAINTANTADTLSIREGSTFAGAFTIVPDPVNGCVTSPPSGTASATAPLLFTSGGSTSTTPPVTVIASGGVATLTVSTSGFTTPANGCVYDVSDPSGTVVPFTITANFTETGQGSLGTSVPGGALLLSAFDGTANAGNAAANPASVGTTSNPSVLIYRLSDFSLFDIDDIYLQEPLGVATDVAGDVYVADAGGGYLTEYAPNAIGAYGQAASDSAFVRYVETNMTEPDGVAVDPKTGDVFVSDYVSGEIFEFSLPYPPGATPMGRHRVMPRASGVRHTRGAAAFLVGTYAVGGHPAGIAIDSADNLYVAFPQASAVSEYASVTGKGQSATVTPIAPVASIGSSGQFTTPTTLWLASDGSISVFDSASAGTILTYAPVNLTTPSSTTALSNGSAISAFAIGTTGTTYATSVANGIVQIATGGGTPASGNPAGPSFASGMPYVSYATLEHVGGPASAGSGKLYVAELGTPGLTETAASANGNVAPAIDITGGNTTISNDYGEAVDASGATYTSTLSTSVSVFAPGANGNVAPARTLTGGNTGLSGALGLAIDSSGELAVANFSDNSITIYASGANGNATPVRTIAGSSTGLDLPYGIAYDSSGDLYVVNNASQGGGTDSITVYAPNANGNVAPLRTITGSATGMNGAEYLALDASGDVYLTNGYAETVTEYAAGANGNVAPIATISGANTTIANQPGGIAVDANGYVYVGVYSSNEIAVFAPGANGNVAPVRTIAGANTGIDGPSQMTIVP